MRQPLIFEDSFYLTHAALLCKSHDRLTGRPLLSVAPAPPESPLKALFHAPFALVAHGTVNDPIFN